MFKPYVPLLVFAIAMGACARPSVPPHGWSARIPVASVGPSCLAMMGRSFAMREVRDPRVPPGTREIDPNDPMIPAAIRALRPVAIDVGPDDVDVVLNRYTPPGATDGEHDRYGIVCSASGTFRPAFRNAHGTFLRPLGSGLWAYDGVL